MKTCFGEAREVINVEGSMGDTDVECARVMVVC